MYIIKDLEGYVDFCLLCNDTYLVSNQVTTQGKDMLTNIVLDAIVKSHPPAATG